MSSPDAPPVFRDDRALSPVIGVVLMIGIFVTITAVIGAFVLGFAPTQSPPEGEMAFIEEGSAGVGIQVVKDVGDDIDADNVEFQLADGTTCEGWGDSGTISTGDQTTLGYCDGDDLEEGDTIRVIWSDDTESRSAIIDSYELRGEATLAEYNCEEYDEIDRSEDITIKSGDTVACDIGSAGDRWDVDLKIKEDGTLIGDVYLDDDDGKVELDDGRIVGDVDTLDKIELEDGSEINGDVTSGDEVELEDDNGDGSVIRGDVTADAEVEVEDGSEVGGDVTADAEVEVEDGSEVGGDVTSNDDVDLEDDSEIFGDVQAGGDIDLAEEGDQARIHGDATAEGSVDIDEESEISGDVEAGGDIDLNHESEISGTLSVDESADDVDIDLSDSEIGGDVIDNAGDTELDLDDSHVRGTTNIDDGRIQCDGDSTIDGESC